ncbi:hypothetical protein [Spiroplasma endosymbiont of Colias croceus]|uniref:hypothetical protein n=1 Tax=Spiroplasma endosymbiont of Colias croceus TaxID=3066310 RepID=UPI0030D21229
MNKKELFGTLSGILVGGIGLTLLYENSFDNDNKNEHVQDLNSILLCTAIVGSIIGGMIGLMFGQIVSNCIEERSETNAYREFFESQRIEPILNQLVNETTPLLQEHIININNEQNLSNTNISSNYNNLNSL